MKKRCAVFTNIAPLYSRPLWYELDASKNIEYTFYSSGKGFSGIETIDVNESCTVNQSGGLKWLFLKNIFIGKILIYQTGMIFCCLRTDFDAYILSGEMYSISNWAAALICRVRKKPLLFWGHGLYGSEKTVKKFVRLLYYRLADYHLVYGNRSKRLMIGSDFNPSKVFTVYNSLDFKTHQKLYNGKNLLDLENIRQKLFPNRYEFPVIIYIGRLTKEKKISILIEAVSLCKSRGNLYNCLIVGGGDELETLKHLSESLGIRDAVCFYGPSYDENVNSKLIMLSVCCVSPGNVGLTAIHSLSFGTPVITHRNFNNQGPEVESVIQDETGMFFEEDDITSLSDVIDNVVLNKKKLLMETNCIAQIAKYWNPGKQAEIFDEAVLKSIKN